MGRLSVGNTRRYYSSVPRPRSPFWAYSSGSTGASASSGAARARAWKPESQKPLVIGSHPSAAASFAAMQAVRALLDGVTDYGGAQWGTVHLMDGMAPAMRSFRIAKDPACKGCGSEG